jgi:hypothetical protein
LRPVLGHHAEVASSDCLDDMREPSIGANAHRDGLSMAFKYWSSWHLATLDESVDVANAGDMAVYRGTYAQDSKRDGVTYAYKGNFDAGFRPLRR